MTDFPDELMGKEIIITINGPIRSGKSFIASKIMEMLEFGGYECVSTTNYLPGNNEEEIKVTRV